ncbi:glycerol kinase [Vulcanimicrobium alpinum]|uniref:Glycerol kinase n=1 Tax=Vulcanimicrobium alpinum TaxID=3016050 RepID=A0AAN1XVB3_UNVUL|nr:glycerol kinase GlpK [Vulcanimicrobium alpinum]BDE04883.1 glycerol kinase [Vulcanimicrobium alpinum]
MIVLALDAGTTSSRAIAFDRDGAVLGFDQRELTQFFPRPGWVEHDPREIWTTQLETARAALRNAGATAADVAAIGITNQRETAILWDRATGAPVAPAIVWQDRRTADRCDALRANGLEPLIRAQTGLVLDPYFSATKIAWLLDRVAGLRGRAERGEIAFGTVDAWLIWNFSGGSRHVTDVTNASRTMLFDIRRLTWSDALLDAFAIPRALLPEVLPCTAAFATAGAEHLGAPILIAGVAGDQQAALVGQACFRDGLAKSTYGTGSFVVLNTGARIVESAHGLLATIAYGFTPGEATYALEGSVFVTGAAVQWLRDGLGIIERASDVERLARTVDDNGGCFFVPAFTGLGTPYWDPHARGTIVGITRGTTRGHLARAALEAMAFQTADVIDAMERDAGLSLCELRVDGGAAENDLAMQFQADVLGVPVVRPSTAETTALGAAYLAGLQAGYWEDLGALARRRRERSRFVPAMPAPQRAGLLAQWRRAVARSRDWEQAPSS